MTAILITGASTPLGEHLVQSYLSDTRVSHVLAVAAGEPSPALRAAIGPRLTYRTVNLSSSRRVRELLFGLARDLECEIIVHLSQHRSAHAKGKRARNLNVESTRSILDLADRHPTLRRLVLRSFAQVYKIHLELPTLITENHPLNLGAGAPQFIRDRVEADLSACSRMGLTDCEIVVLRTAETLAAETGSQLHDFVNASVCVRPAGFDPMLNLASVADISRAIQLATHGSGEGVFNIPGYDTLPLSAVVHKWGTPTLSLPGPLVKRLYTARHWLTGSDFRYGMNQRRMHYGMVLDGTRAKNVLRYSPTHPIQWPKRD